MREEVRKTTSLCPDCLAIIPATIFAENGRVWIEKGCKKHGHFKEIYWGSYKMYKRAERFARKGRGLKNPNVEGKIICPKSCGLCSLHNTNSTLTNVVLTNRCDLNCWYCLPFDEELIVKTNGLVKSVKIGELVEGELSKVKNSIGPVSFSIPNNLSVLSYSKGKCVWTRVKKLLRRKYSGDFIEVKTSTGRKVRTTVDHRFIVKQGQKVTKKRVDEIGKNEMLLSVFRLPPQTATLEEINLWDEFRGLPKSEMAHIFVRGIRQDFEDLTKARGTLKRVFEEANINTSNIYSWRKIDSMPLAEYYRLCDDFKLKPNGIRFGVDAKSYSLPKKLKMSIELSKLMGYFIADGHYAKQDLWFTCADPFVRKDIENCLKKLNLNYSVLNYKKQRKAPQIVVGNKLLALAFRYALGIPPKAGNKRLPKQFLNFPLEVKLSLLSGLFNGDGYVVRGEKHASLGLGTVSKNLTNDLEYLLTSINITPRIHEMDMSNNKLANYPTLFKTYIASQDMLKLVDLLDLKPSHLKRLENLSNRRKSLIKIEDDFILERIKNVKRIKSRKEQMVYDLEVENDSHSFIAGNGVLISNCFFYAEKAGYVYEPTRQQIREMLKKVREEKPVPGNAVQITGGEPTLREDLLEIIQDIKGLGFEHIQLNTNGIKLALDPKLAARCRHAGVNNLYLSFDGLTERTNPKNHLEIPRILDNCREAGLGIVLVPTIINNVNDHEAGNILRFGFDNIDIIRSVNYQPVSLVGKMPRSEREKYRITIPDLIEKLEEQTNAQVTSEDFFPVPTAVPVAQFIQYLRNKPQYELSTHFVCGMATYVFKDGNQMKPITRFLDVEGFVEFLNEQGEELRNGASKYIVGARGLFKINSFIDKEKTPKGINFAKLLFDVLVRHDYTALSEFHHKSLFIGMMHFMDLYNYDIERVQSCGIHYVTPNKEQPIIPFCAFNVIPELYRDKIQKQFGLPIKKWEKLHKKKLKEEFYRRDRQSLKDELYYKAYGKNAEKVSV